MLADRVMMGAGESVFDDGLYNLQYGDLQTGYYGEVPVKTLWSPESLTNTLGITEGQSVSLDDNVWLKYSLDRRIIYVMKKYIRKNVSWNHLNSKDAVKGNQILVKNKAMFKIRLMSSSSRDPNTGYRNKDRGVSNSEYNRLILSSLNVKSFTYGSDYSVGALNWNFIEPQEMGIGDKTSIWCIETPSNYLERAMYRGYKTGDLANAHEKSFTGDSWDTPVWQPVLEYIGTIGEFMFEIGSTIVYSDNTSASSNEVINKVKVNYGGELEVQWNINVGLFGSGSLIHLNGQQVSAGTRVGIGGSGDDYRATIRVVPGDIIGFSGGSYMPSSVTLNSFQILASDSPEIPIDAFESLA